jgi:hypothetical protein
MDIHTRIVAILHIVFGALGVVVPLVFGLAFGGLATFVPHVHVPDFFVGLGMFVLGVVVLIGIIEVLAGIGLLKGSRTARAWIVVFGVLDLFKFPWGTLLGIYTLWALLRKQPVPDVV